MNAAEVIAALSALPPETPVIIDQQYTFQPVSSVEYDDLTAWKRVILA